MRGYRNLVQRLKKAKTVLIVGHQNSDPDAVCSAYALQILAHKINRKLKVSFTSPEGISKLSKQILGAVPIQITESAPDPKQFDLIITVDTNTLQQLSDLRDPILGSGVPIIMIDHHAPHPENAKTATLVLCDAESTSTCEIILDMYQKMHLKLDCRVSQALLIGVLVETGHLSIANKQTLKSTYLLVKNGGDPETALALIRTTMDGSERIARIRAAQRVHLERVNDWLIGVSELGSYHASAARALVALGAHLAIVAGRRNEELTVSFRSTHEFTEGTGMHLGTDLAAPLGMKMGGMGGGHSTAAGANGKGNANEALRLALQLVREFLSRAPKNNTKPTCYAGVSSQTSVTT